MIEYSYQRLSKGVRSLGHFYEPEASERSNEPLSMLPEQLVVRTKSPSANRFDKTRPATTPEASYNSGENRNMPERNCQSELVETEREMRERQAAEKYQLMREYLKEFEAVRLKCNKKMKEMEERHEKESQNLHMPHQQQLEEVWEGLKQFVEDDEDHENTSSGHSTLFGVSVNDN